MLREIAQIVLAIQLFASPKLPTTKANSYAHVMQIEADKIDVDPFIFVAITEHECNSTSELSLPIEKIGA